MDMREAPVRLRKKSKVCKHKKINIQEKSEAPPKVDYSYVLLPIGRSLPNRVLGRPAWEALIQPFLGSIHPTYLAVRHL